MLVMIAIGGLIGRAYVEWRLYAEVSDEIDELREVFDATGRDRLIAEIERRTANADDYGPFYKLVDGSGGTLAGSAAIQEIAVGAVDYVPPGKDADESQVGEVIALAPGLLLLVAGSTEVMHDVDELALGGALATVLAALPLSLIGGWLMARMVLRRVDGIDGATRQIREEGLMRRVPVSGSGDEFDRLSQSINAMLDSIEALTRNIQNVSSGIAHDLRTPLTRLHNLLETLGTRAEAGPALRDELDHAVGEVGLILETFDALLRIGQIDAGTRRSGFRMVDLSGLVAEVADTFAAVAEDNGKRLDKAIQAGVQVNGDRPLLTQVVANLVENAIEHTPAGTAITIDLHERDGRPVLVVADTGPGIPEADRGRVFERFVRLERSRGRPGHGLGLSLVRAIANLHGIEIAMRDGEPGLAVELAF